MAAAPLRAVPAPPPPASPARGWRDELTPLSRASRRRWACAFALLIVLFACGATTISERIGAHWAPSGLLALTLVVAALKRSTRRVISLNREQLDERDQASRDRSFRLAYPIFLLALAAAAAALLLISGDQIETTYLDGHGRIRVSERTAAVRFDDLWGFALVLLVLAAYLPTVVLAWREPDPLPPEPDEPRPLLGEPARDTLLGAALALSLALGAGLQATVAALLPLLVAVAVAAVAARFGSRPRSSGAVRGALR